MLIRKSLLLILLIILIRPLESSILINGKVQNLKTSKEIPGVNIYIQKLGKGTVSNDDGCFTLEIDEGEEVNVEFSHIAYETVFKKISAGKSVSINMKEIYLQMDDIVVTSMRSGYLLRDVPINTEVIGKKYIENSGAITVSELLEQRAGVSTDTNVDGGFVFKLLGMDSRYILILRDGQPVTGRFNNIVDLNQVSLYGIEKIEITKGSGSAIYGSEAMGGVINIISKKELSKLAFNFRSRLTTFSDSFKNLNQSPFGNIFSMNLSVPIKSLYFYTTITGQSFNRGQDFEYINADRINKLNIESKMHWDILEYRQSITLGVNHFSQVDSGATHVSTGSLLFSNSTDITRSQFYLNHNWSLDSGLSIKQSITKDFYQREYLQKSSIGSLKKDDLTEERNLEYEIMFLKKTDRLNFNGGLEISEPTYMSDRIKSGIQKNLIGAVFVQQDFHISSSQSIVAGARGDNYDDKTVFSPRIAYAFSPNDYLKYRLSYGYGFRAPSFMEKLIDWNHYQFNYQVIGNPDLKPETSKGLTLGLEFSDKEYFQISGLLYHNIFSNLIEDYVLEPGKLSYYNVEQASFTGLELIVNYLVNNNLSTNLNLNYSKNADQNGNEIPNSIPLSIGLRSAYSIPRYRLEFSLSTKAIIKNNLQEYNPEQGTYTSLNDIDPYGLIDIQLRYNINKRYKVSIGAKNVGNHVNSTIGPYIGRTGYFEFSTRL